jgi:DNA-binding HxlR family transcriptional regulator
MSIRRSYVPPSTNYQLTPYRQDIREMVGTLCVYYMVEEIFAHVAKEIT